MGTGKMSQAEDGSSCRPVGFSAGRMKMIQTAKLSSIFIVCVLVAALVLPLFCAQLGT